MARRRKKATKEMRELRQKIAGMKSINPNFDAGNGVTVEAAETLINETEAALEDFNKSVATTDEKDNFFGGINKQVRDFNRKVIPATGLKYGRDSSEYEQVGGVRDSDRKKRTVKPKMQS
ncbi:MAG: hypothetical protein WA584_17280 [Pyrinomonadaceae bacterium]